MSVPFQELFTASSVILGEGAVIERLQRSVDVHLDEHVVNSALIYQDAGRSALETICRQTLSQLVLKMSAVSFHDNRFAQ